MQLVLLGAPGAGKGTQGQLLEERFALVRISTGDLLRAALAEGSELGNRAQQYMSRGELVPDDLILDLMRQRLLSLKPGVGFILDGFPRNVNQAQKLQEQLKEIQREQLTALYLEVPEDALIARLTGRRVCPECGATFHVTGNPSKEDGVCDSCHCHLITRPDDTVDVITNRLAVYREQTEPVLSFYEQAGVLKRIDGQGELAEIFERVLAALGADGR